MNMLLITGCASTASRLDALLEKGGDRLTARDPASEELVECLAQESIDVLILDARSMSPGRIERRLLHCHRLAACLVMVDDLHDVLLDSCLAGGAHEILRFEPLSPLLLQRALQVARFRFEREKRLHDALEQAQKMEAIGRMTGGVAHDYGNLLGVIMNQAVLVREALPEHSPVRLDVEEQMDVIRQAIDLSRQLLSMARRHPPEASLIELNEWLQETVKILRHVTGRRVRLEVHGAGHPVRIRAHAGQLGQALLNLVINACDAMANEGTIDIGVSEATPIREDEHVFGEVLPRLAKQRCAVLAVRDYGPGIPEQRIEHVFEPFFTTKQPHHGTGLGLYQVYSMVRQHEGVIGVGHPPGGGALFRLYFPRQPAGAAVTTGHDSVR